MKTFPLLNRLPLVLLCLFGLSLLASCAVSRAEKAVAPVSKIALSRTTNGWGGGEAFDLTLHSDGKAQLRLITIGSPTKVQTLQGQLTKERFAQLAALMEEKGFFAMKSRYDGGMTDQAATNLAAWRGDASTLVSVDGDAGPPEFYEIVQALRAERKAIQWSEVKPAKAKPKAKPRAAISKAASDTKKCERHKLALQNGQAPILYGLPAPPAPGYFAAEKHSFPHAQSVVLGGCVIMEGAPHTAKVVFCPRCRAEEARWLNAHRKSVQKPKGHFKSA